MRLVSPLDNSKKIVEYYILRASVLEVNERIEAMIEAGWQPHGSPSAFAKEHGEVGITQAMVKYEVTE